MLPQPRGCVFPRLRRCLQLRLQSVTLVNCATSRATPAKCSAISAFARPAVCARDLEMRDWLLCGGVYRKARDPVRTLWGAPEAGSGDAGPLLLVPERLAQAGWASAGQLRGSGCSSGSGPVCPRRRSGRSPDLRSAVLPASITPTAITARRPGWTGRTETAEGIAPSGKRLRRGLLAY